MCGGVSDQRSNYIKRNKILGRVSKRDIHKKEIELDTEINNDNFSEYFYLAIPLHNGQLSCREIINGVKITKNIKKDTPLTVEHIDGPYNSNSELKEMILKRELIYRNLIKFFLNKIYFF